VTSIEVWAAATQIGTFVVIAVTAVAALVQLNHIRSANLVSATNAFHDEYDGPELRDAFSFVRTQLKDRLEDQAFRAELRALWTDRVKHPEIMVCNFFDKWGAIYRHGAIDQPMFMQHDAHVVLAFWQRLEPVIALVAHESAGSNVDFQQFEYLAVQAQDWIAAHPQGDYPRGVRRMPITDRWKDVDERDQSR
jgi:hypothetical protein